MHVALYHNPNAGTRTLTAEDVGRLLRAEGHEVETFRKGDDHVDAAIAVRPNVLVAAGGDGTIAAAAKALWKHRSSIPLYVLPLGTSNNIASSLGVSVDAQRVARGLASARETVLDIGVIDAGDREMLFVEAAGVGFFGAALDEEASLQGRMRRAIWRLTGRWTKGEARVRDAAFGMARRIRGAPARQYELLADGVDVSGEYVAIEAMNIRSIGPRMCLAPEAISADGLLDLVLVRPGQRAALATLIESQQDTRAAALDRRRVREVELSWTEAGHLDDEPLAVGGASPNDRRVRVRVGGCVRLLLPP